jgi:cytochrome c oxidase cbb3-type subunit III
MNNDPQEPRLLEHEADGIRELDNLLPRWWVWLFYLTIAFAVVYLVYYHGLHIGILQAAEYDREFKRGQEIKAAAIVKFESSIDTLQPDKDPTVINQGHQIFLTYCAPCHRPDAGGQVGPNLTDDYWIHGSNYVDNIRTIINGVPARGMLTWRGILNPYQIKAVGSYIYTLRGSNPKNPKPPENTVQAPTGPSQFE